MTTWKPGDVVDAYVPSRGRRHTLLRVSPHVHDDGEWPWLVLDDDAANGDLLDQGIGSMNVRDARLLFSSTTGFALVDPESAEQVERLADLYWGAFHTRDHPDAETRHITGLAAALREFAAPTPPKPAEPTGLGAVVEDADGKRFVRCDTGWYRGEAQGYSCNWAAVKAVRVLSEGVTP